MTKMYCVGTYSSMAMEGFVANPTQDRKQIVEAMTASTGIHLVDFHITRGVFDFVAVCEETIEKAMAIKIALGSTDSLIYSEFVKTRPSNPSDSRIVQTEPSFF